MRGTRALAYMRPGQRLRALRIWYSNASRHYSEQAEKTRSKGNDLDPLVPSA